MHITRLQLPRLVVKYLHILYMLSSKLDEVQMRRILAHVVISVLFALELYHKAVGKGSLEGSISFRQTHVIPEAHGMTLIAVVPSARKGLDVWLLGAGTQTFVSQCEHFTAGLIATLGSWSILLMRPLTSSTWAWLVEAFHSNKTT